MRTQGRRSVLISAMLLMFTTGVWAQDSEAAAERFDGTAETPLPVEAAEPLAEPVYRLGVGDAVTVSVLGLEEIREHQVQVGTTGIIDLLLVGRVHAAGLTVEELRTKLIERLGHYMNDPQVSVSLAEFHSQPVSVIGAVNSPGVLQIEGSKTLVEVLSLAGGLKPEANYSVRITRQIEEGQIPLPGARNDPTGRFSIAEVDINEVMQATKPEHNIFIRRNDVISVSNAEMVYVIGGVNRAGAFALQQEEGVSILQAVSMANGLRQDSAPGKARILRVSADSGIRQEVPVDLKSILGGKQADFFLQPNDILFVPDSKMKSVGRSVVENVIRMAAGMAVWSIR